MSKLIPSSSLGNSATTKTVRVGVLGLQGDFAEHLRTLERIGAQGIDVRRPAQLDEIDALIIPGGESTTIGKLAARYEIIPKLRARVAECMPVWGTCAGAIFLANQIREYVTVDFSISSHAYGSAFWVTTGFLGALSFVGLLMSIIQYKATKNAR